MGHCHAIWLGMKHTEDDMHGDYYESGDAAEVCEPGRAFVTSDGVLS